VGGSVGYPIGFHRDRQVEDEGALDGNKLILFTWNTALNQLRDLFSLSGSELTIVRATEQPGPSTNATLTGTRGS
jgi:hypothetical protein